MGMSRENIGGGCLLKILFLGLLFFPGCFNEGPVTIRINGSTTVHPIMQKALQRYGEGKGLEIELRAEESGKGIAALVRGDCDIATSSRKISDSELQEAGKRGMKIREFVLAHDLIVPVVHPANPVEDVSLEHLRGIYSGKVMSWDELGGPSGRILVVGRDGSSGTHDVWQKLVLGNEALRGDCEIKGTGSGVLAFVSEHENSIGYVSGAFLNPEVKPLRVNGIAPSRENGSKGIYPVYRALRLYVSEKALRGEIRSLITFLLGDPGQEAVLDSGFIPLNTLETPVISGPIGMNSHNMPS